jgi:uncharacterized membrane protein YphA (DoxX/SURF4 family)/peroxiredoxin
MKKENKALSIALLSIRIFVGLLFIFSGLIKANDPSGLAYKMGEFFEVWAREGYAPSLMHALDNFKLLFSIIMIIFEIVAGVALIIGYRFRLFSYLILLLTIFFTFLTAYAMFSGKIKECGCFGDCIKLQANESFMKDLILLALMLILVFFRNHVKQIFSNKIATGIMVFALAASYLMQWYVLKHLPFKDCLAYKPGNNLLKEMTQGPNYVPAEFKSILQYKNKQTGEIKDFDQTNFPWQDTVNWVFADNKTIKIKDAQNEPPIHDFVINNYNGEDITQTVLAYPGYVFLVFIKDVKEANTSNIGRLRQLAADAQKANIPVLALSASNDVETEAFNKQHQLSLSFYSLDGTVIKTAMRSNPGVMLLYNGGTVVHKWSYADYPILGDLQLDLQNNTNPLFAPSTVSAIDSTAQQ